MADLNKDLDKLPDAPKIKLGPVSTGPEPGPDFATTSASHNTYRPDIYRTSEGYMS